MNGSKGGECSVKVMTSGKFAKITAAVVMMPAFHK